MSYDDRHRMRPLINAGAERLSQAEAALAAGNHLGAMASFVSALGPLRESRASSAREKKARCKAAIAEILAVIGDDAFGPGHCKHGTVTARFGCAACCEDSLDVTRAEIAKEIEAAKAAKLAKTEPDDATETFYQGLDQRRPIEKELAEKKGDTGT